MIYRPAGLGFLISSLAVVMGLTLVGCSGAQGPGGVGGVREKEAEVASQAPVTVSEAVTDLSKFPEPPSNSIGGMPKEDVNATPKYGGVFRTGGTGWSRMDPHFAAGPWGERFFADQWNVGLVRWELKCNCAVLDLAESWEASADHLSYTFKIRKGVKFHNKPPVNGREVIAQDVKWSYDRLMGLGPERKSGVVSINYSRFETVKEVQLVDDRTVKFIMKQPDSNFMREMMYEYSKVLPKEAQVDGFFNVPNALIGAGPFVPELAQNIGLSRFKKNPDYFRKDDQGRQLPYLDEVTAFGGDVNAALAAMSTGQLDLVILTGTTATPLLGKPDLRIYNTRGSMVGTAGLWLNTTKKPLSDLRVRQAINLAYDRCEVIEGMWNGHFYLIGFLGAWQPYHWGDDKMKTLPGYKCGAEKAGELEQAKKLLAEAGYPNGFDLTCICEAAQKGDLLVQQMAKVGIRIKVEAAQSAVSRQTEYMKDKDFTDAFMGGGHTPDYSLPAYFLCNAAKNLSQVCDDQIEKMAKEFRAEFDPDKQIALLEKIQQRLWDLMPVALDGRYVAYHITRKEVRGYRNQFYDCCLAHSSQNATVWVDR